MKSTRKQGQPDTGAPAQSDGLAGEFGKQAGYGNAFIQEQLAAAGKLGSSGAMAVQEREESDEPAGILYINTEFETGDLVDQAAEMVDQFVGHTWITFEPIAQHLDGFSLGFWPDEPYSLDPRVSVAGLVHEPDEHEGWETAKLGHVVSEQELFAAQAYAGAHRTAAYNLYSYNCSDFALEMFEAASLPRPAMSVFGVDFPMSVQSGLPIVENEAKEGP